MSKSNFISCHCWEIITNWHDWSLKNEVSVEVFYFLKKVFPTIGSQKQQETNFYTATELKNIFAFCQESRVHKRHLQRNDLPPLFRWIPIPLIERLVGKHLIFKGFKPLSQAIPILQAA